MNEPRPLLPRIRRAWCNRTGRFIWWCDPEPAGKWGMGISHQARYDWRQAQRWVAQRNAAERP